MTNLKPLVASILALSIAGTAFASAAGNVSPLTRALAGNSYELYVPHHHFKGTRGMWVGALGQANATYNDNYLLVDGTDSQGVLSGPADTNVTLGLNRADLLVGYDGQRLGFFADYGYSNMPRYNPDDLSQIELYNRLGVNEAFMTYVLNDKFAIKAGQFLSDFGSYDPTAPIEQLANSFHDIVETSLSAPVTGVEGVFAANGFHGSVAGVQTSGATKSANQTLVNDTKLNNIIVNGGYDAPLHGGDFGIEASFIGKASPQDDLDPSSKPWNSAWTGAIHYDYNKIMTKLQVYNERVFDDKDPWIYSGSADVRINPRMVIGGYGDYATNAGPFHWTLGAKAQYALSCNVDADFYVQHQTVTEDAKDDGQKNNTSAIAAITFRI